MTGFVVQNNRKHEADGSQNFSKPVIEKQSKHDHRENRGPICLILDEELGIVRHGYALNRTLAVGTLKM
jgi:hypothetical protein